MSRAWSDSGACRALRDVHCGDEFTWRAGAGSVGLGFRAAFPLWVNLLTIPFAISWLRSGKPEPGAASGLCTHLLKSCPMTGPGVCPGSSPGSRETLQAFQCGVCQ